MRFIADLHIHSRYSRATSPNADLAGYLRWARVKGISLVGTGDLTHPQWLTEVGEQLVEEAGLLRFRKDPGGSALPEHSPADIPVRFILSGEISSIYKKKGSTRKVHSLLLLPGLEDARRLSRRLAAIGNIASDGRPILGLDAKDLLSILLEVSPRALFIPAHIWTPWFSLFGSKSGFDAIEDCFEDLTPCITALETGLSSDPPMNWRWSALDRFRLVSNSDAHSPPHLGREATLFETELSFEGVRRALTTGEGFRGTFEFYPEEGKYHMDGHRKCGVWMEPGETLRRSGACPVCGKPLTVGVLHRVLTLADRAPGGAPSAHQGFRYLIPLPEILGELRGTGPGTSAVASLYGSLVAAYGSEYGTLFEASLGDIEARFGSLPAEALKRMREGRINPSPGYDGEFGVIRVFSDGELEHLRGQDDLFAAQGGARTRVRTERALLGRKAAAAGDAHPQGLLSFVQDELDPDQRAASRRLSGPVLVSAGPGTGKTRVLTHWISNLLREGLAEPGEILAVTFTNRAAAEMRERLASREGEAARGILVATFHSFCLSLLRERDPSVQTVVTPGERDYVLRILLPREPVRRLQDIARRLERHCEGTETAEGELVALVERYEAHIGRWGAVDISRLVSRAVQVLRGDPEELARVRRRFRYVAVDELQDINRGQYELLSLFAGQASVEEEPAAARGVFCIGDPDQAIYGFRGSDRSLFYSFRGAFAPAAFTIQRSFRFSGTIGAAASAVLNAGGQNEAPKAGPDRPPLVCVRPRGEAIRVFAASDPGEEGAFIADTIRTLLGGVDSVSADAASGKTAGYSFADLAVLFRTRAVRDALLQPLSRAGLPVTFREAAPLCESPRFAPIAAGLRYLGNPRDAASLARVFGHFSPARPPAELWEKAVSVIEGAHDERDLLLTRVLPDADCRRDFERLLTIREDLDTILASLGVQGLVASLTNSVFHLDVQDLETAIGLELVEETAREFGADLQAFLRQLSLLSLESEGAVKTEKIRLLTFHAAKGLEFPVVFLTGVEEGITPLADDEAEERRLFYVALTRAADLLYISHCARRLVQGEPREMRPSRFLSDIPPDCRESVFLKQKRGKQLSLF